MGKLDFHPPSALERPGTDAYFAAIMTAMRREAEARSISKQALVVTPSWKGRVARTRAGEVTPQLCEGCNKLVPLGAAWAPSKWPVIWCAPCGSEVALKVSHVSKFQEYYGTLETVKVVANC